MCSSFFFFFLMLKSHHVFLLYGLFTLECLFTLQAHDIYWVECKLSATFEMNPSLLWVFNEIASWVTEHQCLLTIKSLLSVVNVFDESGRWQSGPVGSLIIFLHVVVVTEWAWQSMVKGWWTTSLSNHFILKSSKHNYIFIILFHTAVIHKVH